MSEKLSYKNASYYGSGIIQIPLEEVGVIPHIIQDDKALISVLNIDRLYRNSKGIIPQWWTDLLGQAEFIRKNGNSPTVMKLPDKSYLLAGKHIQSFVDWLETLENDGILYDRFIKGYVIDNPTWLEDTNKKNVF